MGCFYSFSQDSIFIKNEIELHDKIYKSIEIDSMFITLNGEKIKFQEMNSLIYTDSHTSDENGFLKLKVFYFPLKGIEINVNSSYMFDLYLDEKQFKIQLPGNYILKGNSLNSNLFIKTFHYKRKIKFLFQKKYGYSFGTFFAISGIMKPH